MPSVAFNPIFHIGVVIGIGAVMVALLLLGPASTRASGRRRAWLVFLRTLAILAIIFSMLRPTLVYHSTEEQTATLIVLCDFSRSMGVTDEGNRSRWERMRESLTDAMPDFNDLGENLNIRFYQFGAEPVEIALVDGELQLPEEPDGMETAIGHSIAEARRQNAGERVIGVVVLTDGNQKANVPRDRPPLNEARELSATNVALHAVAFGNPSNQGQLRDIAIEQMSAPERIFEKNNMLVTAQARLSGYVNRSMQVELLMENGAGEMEVVDSQTIQSRRDGDVIPLELSHIPRLPGEHKVQVRVVDQPGELVTVNNEQSTFVTVESGGISVFFIEGKPRHETKLWKALDESPNIEVTLAMLDAEEYIRRGTIENPRRPDAVATMLDEAFTPGRHDVYILGDVDSKAFTGEELLRLRECVAEGSGLIMLGGAHSFSGGGYANTPLAEVLPVELNRIGNQQFGQPIRSDIHEPGPIQIAPSELEGNHFVTRLNSSRERNTELWQELPPLDGVNKVTPRNNARLLLEGVAPTAPNRRIPVLIADGYGEGRVLAFTGDSTHRWILRGYGDQRKRFWRQLTLWLAKKDQGGDGAVRIALEERRVRQSGRANFTLQAVTAEEEPIPDAEWEASMILPDGSSQPLNLNRRGNEMVGSFVETQLAGDYAIEARATRNGTDLGMAKARFLVFERDLELERPVADTDALAAWTSASSGGRVFTPEQFDELLEELQKLPQQLSKTSYLKVTLWDRWPLYAIIACLMITEWFFRKKWGLV